jgi:hypothetical protein
MFLFILGLSALLLLGSSTAWVIESTSVLGCLPEASYGAAPTPTN